MWGTLEGKSSDKTAQGGILNRELPAAACATRKRNQGYDTRKKRPKREDVQLKRWMITVFLAKRVVDQRTTVTERASEKASTLQHRREGGNLSLLKGVLEARASTRILADQDQLLRREARSS